MIDAVRIREVLTFLLFQGMLKQTQPCIQILGSRLFLPLIRPGLGNAEELAIEYLTHQTLENNRSEEE